MKSVAWLAAAAALAVACGGGSSGPSLDDFLPELPTPDGTAQAVFAGTVTSPDQLPAGSARSGLVGDFYIRNDKASFVIQGPARYIGVVPWGGNVVDAVPLGPDGKPASEDHLGEISMVYVLGRTCAHERVDVLLDGSGGGPAVIRARGKADVSDYLNLQGMGVGINVAGDQDPVIPDGVECATTYTLQPGSSTLEIAWTLFNGGRSPVNGPFGALNDTGGEVESFSPGIGFDRSTIDALLSSGEPTPVPYAVYQGPGVAYGIVPVHPDPATPNATVLIAGVSVVVFGGNTFLDLLDSTKYYLHLPVKDGVTHRLDLVVGTQAADVVAQYERRVHGEAAVSAVDGTVAWAPSARTGAGVRVGVFQDGDGNGAIDATDKVVTYFDTDASGAFAGALPPGKYLLRADVANVARGAAVPLTVEAGKPAHAQVSVPDPALYQFTVVDKDTGMPIPAKLTVIGRNPVAPDKRVQDAYDQLPFVVRMVHAVYGASEPLAASDPHDAPLEVPAGGPYRVIASHGPEWTIASQVITPAAGETGNLVFELSRVVDTSGYIATEFHQHSIGSPDSPVPFAKRLATLVAEGIEFFASTDHDYLSDYDPLIDQFGLRGQVDSVVGIEATPFAYGHFIAFPLQLAADDPTHGAVDWARGLDGYALLPPELWGRLRDRGAKVIQVNHPRKTSAFAGFQSYFDVAGLTFDFAARSFAGLEDHQPVPADYLRLSDPTGIFGPGFDSLEVWNGFKTEDTDGDGVREVVSLDLVMRDWMNFLSFGKNVTPIGNSDSHTRIIDAAGLPRTLIRVGDDSSAAIESGEDDDIYATILGSGGKPHDVVVSNGPMLAVNVAGQPAIGRTISATGSVTFTITATCPDWMDFDTIEVFANATFDPAAGGSTALAPVACFTTRSAGDLSANDPCKKAPAGGARAMQVQQVTVGSGKRKEATVTLSLAATDVPQRTGASGDDAWVVVRVRGRHAVFPMMTNGAITDSNVDTLVSGSASAIDTALTGVGVPAEAFTAPVFVDFDGGGYRAPFAP
jgi:hypothetical protein